MNTAIKYPKTFHTPFSLGLQNDDRRMEDEHCFNGKTVAITIKMDGENTSLYRNGMHARSLYAMAHPSQYWMKAYHAQIAYKIPEGWRVCGENLYARHSIPYYELEHYFQVFSIWDENNECLSLQETWDFCYDNGLTHVPFIRWVDSNDFDSTEKFMECLNNEYFSVVKKGEEGIVIRNIERYPFEEFHKNVAKAVRKGHVQTDEHWTKTWVPNQLKVV
jgi:hypothetical protein